MHMFNLIEFIDFNTTKIYIYFINNNINNKFNNNECITFNKKEFKNIKKEKINNYSRKFYYNLIKKTDNNNNNLVFTEHYDELFRNDKIIIYSCKIKNHDLKCFPNLNKYDHEENVSDIIYEFNNNEFNNIKIINRSINNISDSEITIIEINNNKNIKKFFNNLQHDKLN